MLVVFRGETYHESFQRIFNKLRLVHILCELDDIEIIKN